MIDLAHLLNWNHSFDCLLGKKKKLVNIYSSYRGDGQADNIRNRKSKRYKPFLRVSISHVTVAHNVWHLLKQVWQTPKLAKREDEVELYPLSRILSSSKQDWWTATHHLISKRWYFVYFQRYFFSKRVGWKSHKTLITEVIPHSPGSTFCCRNKTFFPFFWFFQLWPAAATTTALISSVLLVIVIVPSMESGFFF